MVSIALGNFDGVHLAHKAVLKNAAAYDNSICLLFDTHPLAVMQGKAPARLLSREQTEQKIRACGIKRCEYLDFSGVKDLSPEQFFEDILLARYGAQVISCGYNYTFGKARAGDVSLLQKLCRENDVALCVASEVDYGGESISSTRIRRCIESGEIAQANAMLGYRFFYESEIVQGKQLGRELGFPTINQYLDEETIKPLSGVYASIVTLRGQEYRGLTNIGDNPTIGSDAFRSETYLFGFDECAYGETAKIELTDFIREEKKFDTLEALRAQVLSDVERAKDV
ncbi:MAG: riboflavin biosynthesis protein RibF [Clostridia bacterium]|nr:riboflavin biosynthesis protein RibF [Clostridia bacterium]